VDNTKPTTQGKTVMLWKTLVKRVYDYAQDHPEHQSTLILKLAAQQLDKPIITALEEVVPDQDKVSFMRDMFRDAFPKKLQRLPLKVDQNIHGAWRVKAIKETVK
jgi:hypothetical protein